MPDLTGIELLEYAHETRNPATFILVTRVPSTATAIQALNLGAHRYVIKTEALVEDLSSTVEHASGGLALRAKTLRLRRDLLRVFAAQNIVGHSRPYDWNETKRVSGPEVERYRLAARHGERVSDYLEIGVRLDFRRYETQTKPPPRKAAGLCAGSFGERTKLAETTGGG